MPQTITVEVVNHDGEKLFKINELLFDKLDAIWGLEGGTLEIIRQGRVLTQTDEIDWYGTHAETICFLGLGAPWRPAISGLLSRDFLIGDQLKLSAIKENTDLELEVRRSAVFLLGMRAVFQNHHGEKVPIFDFFHEMGDELADPEVDKLVTAPIIRFLA